jgi:hypothetical protein
MTRRRWKRLKWAGTALCALTLLVTWAWAFAPDDYRHPEYIGQHWGFKFWPKDMVVYITTFKTPFQRAISEWRSPAGIVIENRGMLGNPAPLGKYDYDGVRIWPRKSHNATGDMTRFGLSQDQVYIPLISIPLLLLLLVAPPTALFWWLDRRRPGLCRECGYNLTGNVSGRCPECGTPTPTPPG